MRLPRIRFTIRLGMAVVAIVAIAAASTVFLRRRSQYRERAALHAAHHVRYAAYARLLFRPGQSQDFGKMYVAEGDPTRPLTSPGQSSSIAPPMEWDSGIAFVEPQGLGWRTSSRMKIRSRALKAKHHYSLKLKYENASARPWELVSPDPPEPE